MIDKARGKNTSLSLFVHRSFNSLECRPTISKKDHPASIKVKIFLC